MNNAPDNILTTKNKSQVIRLAEKFIFTGGFPEISKLNDELVTKMLQEYFNVMIYRDIVERYSITSPDILKLFIKKAIHSVTGPFSINKTYNDLKSMGYKVSNNYLYEYIDYCNAIFLIQSIDKFSFSEIKREKSDKKLYVIDNGLLTAIDFQFTENKGKLLENLVALEFLKQNKKIFYYKDVVECDFIVTHSNQYLPVQVSWSVSEDSTKRREIRGLLKACTSLGQSKGLIITYDEELHMTVENIKIHVVPFYKYFVTTYKD